MRGRSLHTRSDKVGLKGDSPKTSENYLSNPGHSKAERDDNKRPKEVYSSKQTASSRLKENLNEWELKKKVRNLIQILGDPSYLVKCYDEIKSIPGNMTKGSKAETLLDKLSFSRFEKTANLIKTNQFQFSPSRRVEIAKPNSTKPRPLTIASARDKIVQKAVQLILQAIWENKFLDSSHGFRPNRSVHSALKSIYSKGQTYK